MDPRTDKKPVKEEDEEWLDEEWDDEEYDDDGDYYEDYRE